MQATKVEGASKAAAEVATLEEEAINARVAAESAAAATALATAETSTASSQRWWLPKQPPKYNLPHFHYPHPPLP